MSGTVKRTVNTKEAFLISCREWFDLPKKLFIRAWVETGFLDPDHMATVCGMSEEEIQEDRRATFKWICFHFVLFPFVCVVKSAVYIYIVLDTKLAHLEPGFAECKEAA